MLKDGSKAPLFSLTGVDGNQQSNTYKLEELLKSNNFVVLYFYPKDDTPGCTIQGTEFSRDFVSIKDALVLGVSKDGIESHKSFQKKHDITIPLLVDENWSLAKTYGALKEDGSVIRSTFLINKDGTIKKSWYNVSVKNHVAEVIKAMEN